MGHQWHIGLPFLYHNAVYTKYLRNYIGESGAAWDKNPRINFEAM